MADGGWRKLFTHRPSLILHLLLTVFLLACTGATGFKQALGPREWSFPPDHGRHDGFQIEWWYFTGNLRDSKGREFGYQLTFFRNAFSPVPMARESGWAMNDLYFAHAAISDIGASRFVFKDRLERARPGLAWASDNGLDVSLLDWSAKMESGAIHLRAAEKDFEIDLTCSDGRGPILQGPGGVNAKGTAPGQASYYYSMTRLKTSGSLLVGGENFSVNGESWMDHEFSSNPLAKNQVGWDWMGLQLNDGTDLMLYRMRRADGSADYMSGTKIGADGTPVYLAGKDIEMNGGEPWKSPASGNAYPMVWTVRCAGMPAITVRSLMPGQELITSDSTKVTYFEGAAEVLDRGNHRIGQGYLEITSPFNSLGPK